MKRQDLQFEFETLLKTIEHLSSGSVEEIRKALAKKIPQRTLQRHLAKLVAQKKLIMEGRGRASRYRLSLTPTEPNDAENYVPLSTKSILIKKAVRVSLQNRRPVGYNRNFLNDYRPNKTFYLTPKIHQQLYGMGHSPDSQRPAGTFARKILDRLLIDLSWNSSRLEGNTYSLLDTQRLLELGESAEGKSALESQMILNHKAAIELLVEESADLGFNRYSILNLHALLSDNLLADPQACGRLRTIPVGIAKTVYMPLEIPQLIDECFGQVLDTAAAIQNPFEQAFFIMVQLPYLQPFEDVNKRVSRLAANLPFIRENLCPISFIDVPEQAYIDGILAIYELNRIELLRDVFVWAYERSCARYAAVRHSLGEPDPFRLKYRTLIGETVTTIIKKLLNKKVASAFIKKCATEMKTQTDQKKFIEVTETEVMNLHEGNIARYRLRPSQYQAWKKNWTT